MTGLTILLIRHAEKPEEEWPGPGLTEEGVSDSESLVIRGWQRAGAWAALFGGHGSLDYPRPEMIYAAKPDNAAKPDAPGEEANASQPPAPGSDTPSRRPCETILPLSRRLNIEPIVSFAKGDEEGLAAALVQETGIILVCWEHKTMVKFLLPALVGPGTDILLPPKWPDGRFDVVLRFKRTSADAAWTFDQLFPQLLSGDSNVPLATAKASLS